MAPHIKVDVNSDCTSCDVELVGSLEHVITDREIKKFHLSDSAVKDAVASEKGRRPDLVFLKSPTPWNDMFKSNKWDQITVDVTPISSKILNVYDEVDIISRQRYINNSCQRARYSGSISREIQESFSTTWSKNNVIGFTQEITFSVGVGSSTNFSYSGSWGESKTKNRSRTIGAVAGVSIELEQDMAVMAILQANKRTVEIEVKYEAELNGGVACNFHNKFENHHHWWYQIDDLEDLDKSKQIKQNIEVQYYFDAVIRVVDC